MIINEVYIGRIPEIEEMFKEFSSLRQSYAVWKVGKNSKSLIKLEGMIEKFFGFKAFSLDIDPNSEPNAMTFPVSSSIDVNPVDYLETTSKGYRFKKGSGLAAVSIITEGMFANKAFSDEEVFAAFLHEIGHSFTYRSPMIQSQHEVYKMSLIIQIITSAILGIITLNPALIQDAMVNALAATNVFKLIMAEVNKGIKRVPILREISITANGLRGLVTNTLNNLINGFILGSGIGYILYKYSKFEYDVTIKKQNKITGNQAAYARSNERLSDDFAAMYGFGPQLASALVKMSDPDNQGFFTKMLNRMPIFGEITKRTIEVATELNNAMGAHPGNGDRILYLIESMESDLKKDKTLSPKIKKELAANIAKTKEVCKKIKSNQDNELTNSNEYVQAITIMQLDSGSSEDFLEKRYTNRDKLNKFYRDRKVRKEAALQEDVILAESDLI